MKKIKTRKENSVYHYNFTVDSQNKQTCNSTCVYVYEQQQKTALISLCNASSTIMLNTTHKRGQYSERKQKISEKERSGRLIELKRKNFSMKTIENFWEIKFH